MYVFLKEYLNHYKAYIPQPLQGVPQPSQGAYPQVSAVNNHIPTVIAESGMFAHNYNCFEYTLANVPVEN